MKTLKLHIENVFPIFLSYMKCVAFSTYLMIEVLLFDVFCNQIVTKTITKCVNKQFYKQNVWIDVNQLLYFGLIAEIMRPLHLKKNPAGLKFLQLFSLPFNNRMKNLSNHNMNCAKYHFNKIACHNFTRFSYARFFYTWVIFVVRVLVIVRGNWGIMLMINIIKTCHEIIARVGGCQNVLHGLGVVLKLLIIKIIHI